MVELDPALGRAEPDPEIQELVAASAGPNLGVDFLPGALPFSPASGARPDPELAADVVWLDALTDERRPHAAQPQPAALARPHVADRPRRGALPSARADDPGRAEPFPLIAEHVLLPCAGSIAEADERLRRARGPAPCSSDVARLVPEAGGRRRRRLADYLAQRLRAPRGFVGGGGACPRPA